jgi:hypothetical protein
MDGRSQAQGLRPKAQDALTDAQLDRDIELAVGIEPSPEFLARVRTRIATEPAVESGFSRIRPAVESGFSRIRPAVESGFSRIRQLTFEPLWGVAIVGIVLAIVVPQFMREATDRREVARMTPEVADVPRAPMTTPPVEPRGNAARSGEVRRHRPQPAVAAEDDRGGLRRSRFDDLVLIAPGDQEAFDRLLAVVNDQTIELIAPVLESTRAGVDVIDAAVPVLLRTAEEGVNE